MLTKGRQIIDSLIARFEYKTLNKLTQFVIKHNPNIMSANNDPQIKKTFYRRELPSPPAVSFSSKEGRQLFSM